MPGLKPGFGRLATLGEVFDILYANVPALQAETLGLRSAAHRTLAADVVSEIDVPHFTKAAMDGYAVRAEDTFGASDASPRPLRVIQSVMPGDIARGRVSTGECVEIGTGAPLPEGADAVVMVEYTEPSQGAEVHVRKGVSPRENVVEIGSDIVRGATVLKAGTYLEARHLGVLAAIGVTDISVRRRMRVALFSTGPELVPAGGAIGPGQIFDINTYTLEAALEAEGCEVVDFGLVPDDRSRLDDTLKKAIDSCDLVLLSGGSSLGGGDLVGEAFEEVGKMLVHGVAVKPGKPVVIGLAGNKLLIGLPGYPMSALSDYYIFVQPFLRRASGRVSAASFVEATLSRKHPSTVGRYEFLPVRLDGGEAIPLTKGSSAISALAEADGFVEIDENTEVLEKSQVVRVRLF